MSDFEGQTIQCDLSIDDGCLLCQKSCRGQVQKFCHDLHICRRSRKKVPTSSEIFFCAKFATIQPTANDKQGRKFAFLESPTAKRSRKKGILFLLLSYRSAASYTNRK